MSSVSEIPPADWELWRTMRAMNEQLGRELDRQLQRDAGISQADYGILVTLFEAPDRQLRTGELGDVLAWGMCDKYSWLSGFMPRGDKQLQRATPYDVGFKPKPLYTAIEDAFKAAPARG